MPFKKEPSILDSLENQVALFHKLGAVYANRPEMSSFVGSMQGTRFENHYTAEQVLKDQEYVKDRRSKIENQNSSEGKEHLDRLEGGFQLSEILQAMIVDRMNKNPLRWMLAFVRAPLYHCTFCRLQFWDFRKRQPG